MKITYSNIKFAAGVFLIFLLVLSCKKDKVPLPTLQSKLYDGEQLVDLLSEYPVDSFIGKHHGGGILFYLDTVNYNRGLIAMTNDLDGFEQWGCNGTFIYPVSCLYPDGIGCGQIYTQRIVDSCASPYCAARVCFDLDTLGENDWFLSTFTEAQLMFYAIGPGATGANMNIGNFQTVYNYWTSSQTTDQNALSINMSDGTNSSEFKFLPRKVRPIRYFTF